MITTAVVLLFLAQPPARGTTEAAARQKQVEGTIGQIRRLAASEPVVFGIDTRLRIANVLPASYSKLAAELLRDDESELTGVVDRGEQSALRVRIAAAWGRFDLDQAERAIQSLGRTAQHDYVAEAYDQLYLIFESQPASARRTVSDGLRNGAFRMISASRMLEQAVGHDRAAAAELFSEMLAAFPGTSFFPADVIYLLDQRKQIESFNTPLAELAANISLRAARSERLQDQPKAEREALLNRIAELLPAEVPSDQAPEARAAAVPPEKQEVKPQNHLDLASLSYAEGLIQARAVESLNDRIEALIELSRREDLTADQRTSVASEALHLLGESPLDGDRLVGIAMIARDFARRSEWAMAGVAAEMLAERYTKACDCGGAKCRRNGEEFDCLASVEDFAEYLDEFKVAPESMGLSNISLEARLLILKLKGQLGSH